MSPHPSADSEIELQGYVTDPKLVGYQILTNYENTYWLRLVGRDAWVLYLVLRSFCHEGNGTCNPSIKLLMNILGLTDRRQLIGRVDENSTQKRVLPGLIDILQAHNLTSAEMVGEGPFLRYVFHVNLTPPLLTDEQLTSLPQVLQKKHAQLLERVAEAARRLAALKTQTPANVKKTITLQKNDDGQESVNEAQTKVEKSDDGGGWYRTTPGVVPYHPGGGTVPPKQYPITIPTRTITETRARDNNNSSAEDGEKHAVVVAFLTAQGLAEKVAQRLASRYSRERIAEKIEFLDYLREAAPEQVKNPRGWLRRAIEEDYAAPDGYQSAAERAAAAAEQAREQAAQQLAFEEERRRAEAERESQQQAAAARQAQLQATYGTTQREFDLWQQILAEYKNTMPAATFQMYVAGMVLLSLQDEQALIGLPDKAVRAWVENRLTHKIQRTLAIAVGSRKITVTFVDLAADAALREPAAAGSGHTRDGA